MFVSSVSVRVQSVGMEHLVTNLDCRPLAPPLILREQTDTAYPRAPVEEKQVFTIINIVRENCLACP